MVQTGKLNLRTTEEESREATGINSTKHWKALKNTNYFIIVPEIMI